MTAKTGSSKRNAAFIRTTGEYGCMTWVTISIGPKVYCVGRFCELPSTSVVPNIIAPSILNCLANSKWQTVHASAFLPPCAHARSHNHGRHATVRPRSPTPCSPLTRDSAGHANLVPRYARPPHRPSHIPHTSASPIANFHQPIHPQESHKEGDCHRIKLRHGT